MELLHLLYYKLGDINQMLTETDHEYQEMWEEKNQIEKTLIESMTRKQRALFREYRERKEALLTLELSRLLSHSTICLPLVPLQDRD